MQLEVRKDSDLITAVRPSANAQASHSFLSGLADVFYMIPIRTFPGIDVRHQVQYAVA